MNGRVTVGLRTSWLFLTAILAVGAPIAASAQDWAARDIGSVGASGSASGGGSYVTLRGSGGDVWGTADGFYFVYRAMTGDGEIITHVRSVDYLHAWSKAGVMMRESLNDGAKHAFMLASAGKGDAFQRRLYTNGSSLSTSVGGGPGYYVRLTRSGNNFDAYQSPDGWNWDWVGSEWIDMPATIYVGLAVTSHDYGALTSATLTETTVNEWTSVATVTPPPPPEPAPAPAAPPAPSGGSTFRIMHWNVHHGGIGTDGVYNPWRIAWWIAHYNPEVVTLNEVDDDGQMWNIVSNLNALTGISWHVTSTYKNVVLTRLPVLNQTGCTYGYYSGQTSAETSVLVNGRTIGIWAAHLDADSAYARWSEISTLQYCMNGWSSANIIAGDFNMQAASPEYWTMVGGYPGYIDAWDAARNNGTNYNYSGNCDGCTRNSRIDYQFSSGSAWFLSVESGEMIDTRDGYGYMPSDHKPFIITYRVY